VRQEVNTKGEEKEDEKFRIRGRGRESSGGIASSAPFKKGIGASLEERGSKKGRRKRGLKGGWKSCSSLFEKKPQKKGVLIQKKKRKRLGGGEGRLGLQLFGGGVRT